MHDSVDFARHFHLAFGAPTAGEESTGTDGVVGVGQEETDIADHILDWQVLVEGGYTVRDTILSGEGQSHVLSCEGRRKKGG